MRIVQAAIKAVLLIAAASSVTFAAEPAGGSPTLLEALHGHWVMTGDVRGKPVQYDMKAFPTLQGTFTEIHMTDVQVPSQYEARVFIGADKDGQVIAHWLDSFGGKYSVPHGTGSIAGNTIVINIPYPSGQFRDTLTFQPEVQAWTLSIEAAGPDGSWQHFAKYDIRRKSAGR